MSTDHRAAHRPPRGAAILYIAALILILSQSACTRDDVATALATAAVEMRSTLEPWGATARANASTLSTRIPAALATAKGPAPTRAASRAIAAAAELTPLPPTASPLPTAAASPTPPSSPTPAPTMTRVIPPTATPTPAPPPAQIDVAGGEMVLLSGGSFLMGVEASHLVELCMTFRRDCQTAWFASSGPAHSVTVAPFYMDSHEVTNDVFVRFLNETDGAAALCLGQPCLDTGESQIVLTDDTYAVDNSLARRPAAGVTWYGAAAFCEWRAARLPTEAEWEMAAGWDGEGKAMRLFPWGDTFDGKALNFCDANCKAEQANAAYNDAYTATAPVAAYENGRSPAGLYDMAGNVWEWVADWYAPDYYALSPEDDPSGPSAGQEKVVRGGSWFDAAYFTAAAVRFPSAPGNADKTLGLRCAADVP